MHHFSLIQFSSIAQSWPTLCNPHGLQHARLPCLSPNARACSDSPASSWWCHPTISSCHPLLFLPSTFPSISIFPKESVLRIRWPKYWNFSFSILPMNIQDWFPLRCTGWISVQSKGFSRVLSSTQCKSINSLVLSFLYVPTLTSIHNSWKNPSFN